MNKAAFSISILLLFLCACSTLKKTFIEPFTHHQEEIDHQTFLDSIERNNIKYDWINIRAKINTNNKSIPYKNLGLNIRNRKDSLIWISISAKGIAGLRLMIAKDSIRIMDKIKKKYWVYPFDSIQKFISFPIDFSHLEDMLVGNPFLLDPSYYQEMTIGEYVQLSYSYPRFKNDLLIHTKSYKLAAMKLNDKILNQQLNIKQSEYTIIDGQKMAQTRDINIIRQDSIFFSMKISKVKLNEKTTFPFKVNNKYERLH